MDNWYYIKVQAAVSNLTHSLIEHCASAHFLQPFRVFRNIYDTDICILLRPTSMINLKGIKKYLYLIDIPILVRCTTD